MSDQQRPQDQPSNRDAERVRAQVEAGLEEHKGLWPRILDVTGFLIPRKETNHFSEGMALVMRQERHS